MLTRCAMRTNSTPQAELPKRLARRLMDLQLLPYIVVNNPNIKRVVRAVLVYVANPLLLRITSW